MHPPEMHGCQVTESYGAQGSSFGHYGVTHLASRLPSYTQDAADGHGWVGQLIRRLQLQQWVAHNAPKLQTLGASPARPGPC